MTHHQIASRGLWSEALSEQMAQAALAEIPTDASNDRKAAAFRALAKKLHGLREWDRWDRYQIQGAALKRNYTEIGKIECGYGIQTLQVIPDGRIVCGGGITIGIFSQGADGTWSGELHRLPPKEMCLQYLQFLPDGRILSGAWPGFFCVSSKNESGIWRSEIVQEYDGQVSCLQALSDGRIVLAECGRIRILTRGRDGSWDSEVLSARDGGWANCLQALPNGNIVAGGHHIGLRIWSRGVDGKWSNELVGQIDHGWQFQCLQALPDGRIVSGADNNELCIWSKGADGSWSSEVLEGHTKPVWALQALPDGRIVSGSDDHTLRIWCKRDDGGWNSEELNGHGGEVRSLQVLPDGRIVSGSSDGTIRIWDGQEIAGGAA